MKKTIFVEQFFDQFRLIDPDKIKVALLQDLTFVSGRDDTDFYVSIKPHTDLSLKQNVIDMSREEDLSMLHTLIRHGFSVPPFVYNFGLEGMFPYLESEKRYIIKSFGAARTLGQMVTTKDEIFSIRQLLASKDCDSESFNKEFNIDTSTARGHSEESFLFDRITRGNVYISELIDFVSEYRILYFQGDDGEPIIEERKGYSAGSSEERSHEVVSLENSGLTEHVFQQLKEFGDQHPSPMLSFDVYIKPDGTWGLFEYCPQFGIVYPGYYDIIGKKMTDAMLDAIKKL